MRPANKGTWIAAAVVAVVALLAGGLILTRKGVQVRVQKLAPGELRVVINATTTSTVKSEYEVTMSAQRTGRIVRLAVRDGDRVRAGDLIAKLDLTEESVQSESVHAQSRATFEDARRNLERSEDLFSKGMISQQERDAAKKAHDVARSQYEAAAADVGVRKDYSVIKAPFTGVVAKKYAEVGELLLPGKQIVTLVDPEHIYVLATIDEVDVGRLRLGLPVSITVDAFPGEKFKGVIKRVSPIVSGGKLETRTADVWIYFDKKDSRIKPGMSADIEILISTLKDVIAVPTQTILEREGKKQVYLFRSGSANPGSRGAAVMTPVTVGESNWSSTEVRSGLQSGDIVITTPEAEGLKDGARVQVENGK